MGKMRTLVLAALALGSLASAQSPLPGKIYDDPGDSIRPSVTKTDVQIARRARQILGSPTKWNRADTRVCPKDAKTFSLYCALEKATTELSGNFEHRGAAMQEARFVIEEIGLERVRAHRLMDYNNDARTTFADIQNVLKLLEQRIVQRLQQQDEHVSKSPD